MTAPAVTTPGVYDGMPNEVYQADPVPGGSLSSTGARDLLAPSCPAKYRYRADHGRPNKTEYDFGHAAHKLTLGVGDDLVVVDARDWRTKAAQKQRDEAYEAGKVPLLSEEYRRAEEMAAAVRRHPIAAPLFEPGTGRPEQSLFWVDQASGVAVWRRARLDWIRHPGDGRYIVPDYKTTDSAEPAAIERAIHRYGYHMQGAWYLDAVRALGLADEEAAFLLVFQEKTPPYVITVAQLSASTLRIGRDLNRRALDVYRDCVATGHWPAYVDDVLYTGLPPYIENRYLQGVDW